MTSEKVLIPNEAASRSESELLERLSHCERRTDDIFTSQNTYVTKLTSILKFSAGILTFIFLIATSLSVYKSFVDKDDINRRFSELKQVLEDKYGNIEPAIVEVFDPKQIDQLLSGRSVEAKIEKINGMIICVYSCVFKNVGGISTREPINALSYTNSPFMYYTKSLKNNGYVYAHKKILEVMLPPQMPEGVDVQMGLNKDSTLKEGAYKVMLEVYYGGKKPTISEFDVIIDSDDVAIFNKYKQESN